MEKTRIIEEKVFSYIRENHMLSPGDRVVAGVSGGADSVCLLFVLMEWGKREPLKLSVVHVNHLVRREAGEDADFVKRLCCDLKIPFYLEEADVEARAARDRISVEEAGRLARYEAFERVRHQTGAGRIAVAHNCNDLAETMLFNLFRGTGITGLCGIRPVRGPVIRPLLGLMREETEEYLKLKGIGFCQDCTNDGDLYTRNRIRHHILSYARENVAEGCIPAMARTAVQIQETESYLDSQVEEAERLCVDRALKAESCVDRALKAGLCMDRTLEAESCVDRALKAGLCMDRTLEAESCMDKTLEAGLCMDRTSAAARDSLEGEGGCVIDVKQFLTLHPVIQKRLLYTLARSLSPFHRDIGSVHIKDVMTLFTREGNRRVDLPYGICAVRSYGQVTLERSVSAEAGRAIRQDTYNCPQSADISREALDRGAVVVRQGGLEWELRVFPCEKSEYIPQNMYTKWFDYDKIKKSLSIRPRRTGDFLTIRSHPESTGRKSVKDYMIDCKIPAKERGSIPLLAEDNHILWITGYRISEYYKISKNTKSILQVQLKQKGPQDGAEAESELSVGGRTEEKNGGAHKSHVDREAGG